MEPTSSGFYGYEEIWGINTRKGYDVVGFWTRYGDLKIGFEIPLERRNSSFKRETGR